MCPYTLLELATGSHPVAVLQLDINGHLNLITYNGATGTTHSVYSASDLRDNAWFHIALTATTTAWTVYLNGGATTIVSGSATGMTSAWTWLIVNGDLGANGGSTTGAGLVHGANVSISHLAIYPSILPAWRILAHYVAAVTGFGLLPTPTGFTLAVSNAEGTTDGQYFAGIGVTGGIPGAQYGAYTGGPATNFTMSAVVTATAPGGITSAPSAWSAQAGVSNTSGPTSSYSWFFGSWTGLAPSFAVYNGTQVGADNQADLTLANSSLMTNNYGSSTVSEGIGHTGTGSGATPPTSASAFGDTVAGRIERCLGYGNVTYPGRSIDPAPLLVQAALDVGGQQAGQNVENQALSDGGLLYIANDGRLCYWQKSHLAAQYSSPVWNIGPTTSAGRTPYDRTIKWILDPQEAYNAIEVQPYSPSGAALPIITPSDSAGVTASQSQYGSQPYQVNNYLQSTSEMQSYADWLFTTYGNPPRRAENVKIDAATQPYAWMMILGANVGDVVQLEDWEIGGGGSVYTYRITNIKRKFSYGDDREISEASIVLQISPEPVSYWS